MCGPKIEQPKPDPDSKTPLGLDGRMARMRDAQRRRAAGYGNMIFTSPTGASGFASASAKPRLFGQ